MAAALPAAGRPAVIAMLPGETWHEDELDRKIAEWQKEIDQLEYEQFEDDNQRGFTWEQLDLEAAE